MGVTNFQSVVSAQTVGTADIDKLAASFDKLSGSIDKAGTGADKVSQHPGFDEFARKVKAGIEDPLGAAGDAVGGLLEKMGPMGTAAAAGLGILTAAATAAYGAAKSLGEYATQIENVSIRTGLSTKEVGQFSFAAQVAGQDVSVFESAMRMLSRGMEDNSAQGRKAREGLTELGVTVYNAAGTMRPMSDIFVQVSEGLNAIEDPAKRDYEALKVFGRAGIELMPAMVGLTNNLARAKELGLGPDSKDIQKWEDYHRRIVEVDAQWEMLARRVKDPLAGFMTLVVRGVTGDFSDVEELITAALKQQIPGISVEDARKRLKRANDAGFLSGPAYQDLAEQIHKREIALNPVPYGGPQLTLAQSAIARALAPEGDRGDLTAARAKLTDLQQELQGLMQLGAPYEKQESKADEILAQKAKVEGIEAEVKAQRDLATEKTHLLELDKQSRDVYARSIGAGEGEFGRIYGQRSALEVARAADLAKTTTPGQRGNVIADYALQFAANTNELNAALQKWRQEIDNLEPPESGRDLNLITMKGGDGKSILDRTGEWMRDNLTGDSVTPPAGWTSPQFALRNARDTATRSLGLFGAQAQLAGMPQGDEIAGQYALRKQLADDEYAALMRIAALKGPQEEKDEAAAEAEEQRHQKLFDADMERDQALLAMALQQKQAFESFAVGGFNALASRRPGAFQEFLKSQGMEMADKVVGNAAGMAFSDISSVIPHAQGGILGQLLQGTPFGPTSKLDAAGDHLILSASALMDAAHELAMSPSGGCGASLYGSDGSSAPGDYLAWATGGSAALSMMSRTGGGSTGSAASRAVGLLAMLRPSNTRDSFASDFAAASGGGSPDGYTADGTPKYAPEYYDASGNYLPPGSGGGFRPNYLGAAAAMGGAAIGAYSGFSRGGVQGDLQGTASIVAGVTSTLADLSKSLKVLGPVGDIISMGLGIVSLFTGNTKEERAQAESNTAWGARYTPPTGTTYMMDRYGQQFDADVAGNARPIIQVNIPVQAMDAQSFQDQMANIVAAVNTALEGNLSQRLAANIRTAANPPR